MSLGGSGVPIGGVRSLRMVDFFVGDFPQNIQFQWHFKPDIIWLID